MFRRFSKIGILAAAAGVMAMGTAFANAITISQLTVTAQSGTATNTLSLSGTNPFWNFSSADTGGWSASGSVTAIASPLDIDLDTNSAACQLTTSCGALMVTYDVSGLTSSPALLANSIAEKLTGSVNVCSGGSVSPCMVTQTATIGGVQIGKVLGFNNNQNFLMYTVGPSSGSYSSYTLSIFQTFTGCSGSKTCAVYNSVDGSLTSASEPGALAIFGAGLLGCALFVSRRRRASRLS